MTGPVRIGEALAGALDSIARGIDPTLQQIEAAAMAEIAKILGWPLDAAAWENIPVSTASIEPWRPPPEPPVDAEALAARLKAIAEFTPPTDPFSVHVYGIAADIGPRAAKAAIQEAAASGEITKNQANTLIWALALGRV